MGKPCECEQEAVNSVAMAGCTDGTVERAEPTVMDADVDRTATLGGDLVERVHIVGEGDGTERRDLRLQETELLCEESRQCNGNTRENVPEAHGLPLEGEWTVCASGEMKNPSADGPSESKVAKDTAGVKSKGCKRSTSERACIDEADGDPGHGVEPADVQNESDMLVIVSIESEDLGSGGVPRVRLGSMSWRADNANGLRSQTDGPGGLTDAPSMSNKAETDVISHGDGMNMYLGAGDAKRDRDVQSIRTDAVIPEKATHNVRTTRTKEKPLDLPMETMRGCPDEPNGCGNHADGSHARTDVHTTEDETQTAVNKTENVRKRRNGQRTQNSPYTAEIEMPKPTR